MDAYGRGLAAHLPVRELRSDVGVRSAGRFGVPTPSRAALSAARADAAFIARLRRERGLLHFTSHHCARYGPLSGRPYVVTVHDLIRHFDAWGTQPPFIERPTRRDGVMLALDRRGIRRAAHVVAVSDATRADVIEHLGVAPEHVTTVPEGIDHALRPVERRLLAEPYVLFVGSEHPRKNLATLFRALAELRRDPAHAGLRLVKVGAPGRPAARFRPATQAALAAAGVDRSAVLLAGPVSPEDLAAWYSGAAVTVLPSLAEGFGLPPLEAMACGSPVIVSTAGALPEITADAALHVDARSGSEVARAMRAVLTDEALRATLVARGRRRAAAFTWRRAAAAMEEVYARAAACSSATAACPRPSPYSSHDG